MKMSKCGMIVQVVDKFGQAVNRKWFSNVRAAEVWLDSQYPRRDVLGYTIEILSDGN